jgi:hypothetical protein
MCRSVYMRAGAVVILATLAGCDKPAESAAVPKRAPGLWEQVLTRDGKPGRLGGLKMCLDADADARMGVFGRHFAKGDCKHSITRDAQGAYRFSSTCRMEDGAVVISRGVATGDFKTAYRVRSDIDVTGAPFPPMNGPHEIEVSGHYVGPCPVGMRPGDVNLGSGLRVNLDRLPRIAGALAGS